MTTSDSVANVVGGIFALLAATAFAQEHTIAVGAVTRSYVVHLPNGRVPTTPAPVVIVFHGGGGNAANAARMSGMDAKADKEGFIAVYPNGTGRLKDRLLTWNAWRCCGSALDNQVDDVGFVRAMVQAIASEYPVDRKRIYATGLSNGAMMSYRVGCELSDIFAAIAPVAGALNTDDCRPPNPVSVIAFHGAADKHVVFEGGAPITAFDSHKRTDNSVKFAMDAWRRNNHCEGKPKLERNGNIGHITHACPNGAAVELYVIEDGGHAWPKFATNVMWDFFARHPRGL